MPQNDTSAGPAPVPYGGASQEPEPPPYGVDLGALVDHSADVMHGVTNLGTVQQAGAHDIASADMGVSATADAPYYPGALAPINAAGDNDAGGRDDVSGTVGGAVAAAQARWGEFQADTYKPGPVAGTAIAGLPGQQQGSVIGDLMDFPASPLDPGAGVGNTTPTGGFYDPPRGYGATQGAPNYGGEQGIAGEQGAAQ